MIAEACCLVGNHASSALSSLMLPLTDVQVGFGGSSIAGCSSTADKPEALRAAA